MKKYILLFLISQIYILSYANISNKIKSLVKGKIPTTEELLTQVNVHLDGINSQIKILSEEKLSFVEYNYIDFMKNRLYLSNLFCTLPILGANLAICALLFQIKGSYKYLYGHKYEHRPEFAYRPEMKKRKSDFIKNIFLNKSAWATTVIFSFLYSLRKDFKDFQATYKRYKAIGVIMNHLNSMHAIVKGQDVSKFNSVLNIEALNNFCVNKDISNEMIYLRKANGSISIFNFSKFYWCLELMPILKTHIAFEKAKEEFDTCLKTISHNKCFIN